MMILVMLSSPARRACRRCRNVSAMPIEAQNVCFSYTLVSKYHAVGR
jgi:hypothetical protein